MAETKLKQQAIKQPIFTAATFQNSWVNYSDSYSSAGYYKDSSGVVHLKGLIKSGTVGQAIFTLPAGYRPGKNSLFAVLTSYNVVGRCQVGADGIVYASAGSNDWFSLDGISFLAEA